MGERRGVLSMAVISRKAIIDYLSSYFSTTNVALFDEFESQKARHICPGIAEIVLLDKKGLVVPMPDGSSLNISYFFCLRCKKLYLNKNELTVSSATPLSPPVQVGYTPGMMGGCGMIPRGYFGNEGYNHLGYGNYYGNPNGFGDRSYYENLNGYGNVGYQGGMNGFNGYNSINGSGEEIIYDEYGNPILQNW